MDWSPGESVLLQNVFGCVYPGGNRVGKYRSGNWIIIIPGLYVVLDIELHIDWVKGKNVLMLRDLHLTGNQLK